MTPVGDSRTDFDIINELYSALDGNKKYASVSDVFVEIAENVPMYQGLSIGALGDEGVQLPTHNVPQFIPVAKTSGKVEAGKLALVTGAALNHCGTLSRFGEGPMYVCPTGYIELSSKDAGSLKVEEDQQVVVKSANGEIRLKAKVSNRLPEGVVFAPYHFADESINNLTDGSAVTWVTIGK